MTRAVAVVVARRLDRINNGNSVYLKNFVTMLHEQGNDITLVFAPKRSFANTPFASIHPGFSDLAATVLWPGTFKIFNFFFSTSLTVWARSGKRLLQSFHYRINGTKPSKPASLLGHSLSEPERRHICRVLSEKSFDIVITEYSSLGPVLKDVEAKLRCVFLHDLFSSRAISFRSFGRVPDHAEITLADEAARCDHADLVIHASVSELSLLEAQLPRSRHVWMRPTFKTNNTVSDDEVASNPKAVFIGTSHEGNATAVQYLLTEIWPQVRAMNDRAQLWIVGDVSKMIDKRHHSHNGVSILGRVEALRTVGGSNSVGLAPTSIASGISIKVLEYMNLEMPVVALPSALEGYGELLNNYVVLSNNSMDFARNINLLLADADRRVEIASRGRLEVPMILSNDEIKKILRLRKTKIKRSGD